MVNVRAIQRQANIVGWLLMIPTIIGISLFIIYPVIFSLIMSFTNWKFVFINVSFIGGDNYVWLFSESGRQFWISVWTSIKFTFISTAIQTVLGFFLAYVLYNMKPKAQAVYKVLIYIPVLLPAAVVSVMWTFIFEPNVGLIDVLLTNLGFKNLPLWVADENIALGSVIFVNTWQYLGVTTIIYFIAMNAISRDVIEGATIDGAGKWLILWRFILPLSWSSTSVNLLLSIMGGLKSFDLFYLFTNGTGDHGLYVVGLYIWRTAYRFKTFCRAVTMSIVLSVIIAAISLTLNWLLGKTEDKIDA
ncbi:MAG TPA: sugar ABC transporter permease [Candidatus Borkfalkia excrementigallinarum]|uniref:Sugar ABC transporter permease n=1 Tax=Candidatus Borkfalkia excrementigallinarum TaxID=2838506 RepID=A0A9D1ZVA3_9FIRM|nr:sugar ABC transporter permease [Candidatus Borkfalkia excrementigallinarum]